MAKTKAAKTPANNRDDGNKNLGLKAKKSQPQSQQKQKKPMKSKPKQKNPKPIPDEDPVLFGSAAGSGSESDGPPAPSSPESIQSLLEPYTKPQLIGFLLDAAQSDPELRARIGSLADSDISHRKIFVYGLGWDATRDHLVEAFSPFGPIEDCNVIVDKVTGRAKGYGFVLFKARSGAVKALKEPQKRIGSRMTSCQLASIGGPKPDGGTGRKIYVGNVQPDVQPGKLREFFAQFGEIETGPIGFDAVTGKSRGYAMFVYKTQEEAKKALEEPYKVFEGHQLHCKMAVAGAGEVQKAATPPVPQVQTVSPAAAVQMAAPQQTLLAAVAAAQNLALLGQNPAYAALLAQNPLLAAAALNPALANAAAWGGGMAGAQYGGGAQSVLGAYNVGQGTGAIGLQGLQGYQGGSSSQQGGQQSDPKAGGTLGGFRSSYV